MLDLKGKKLLFMDGSMLTKQAVEYAKSLGIYTIVANFYDEKHAPSKSVADKTYKVDIFDIDAMLEIISKEKIDGIFGGYADSHLPIYAKLCKLANLSCYGTEKLFDISIDKIKFKEMCRENGVPVVEDYDINDVKSEGFAEYPLYVKPIDSGGSKGCAFCNNYLEFSEAVKEAYKYSKSKKVIIEKYYDSNRYQEFIVHYSVRDGQVSLAAIADRHVIKVAEKTANLPNFFRYPSIYTDNYMKKIDKLVVNMLRRENFKNGPIIIQGFTDGENFVFFEMGYRLGGCQHQIYTEYYNGTNDLKDEIEYAVYGKISNKNSDNPYFNKPTCQLVFYLKPGRVKEIRGIERLSKLKGVINYTPWINVGDEVGIVGTLQQSLGRFFISCDTEKEMQELIKYIRLNIEVISDNNENMLLN